MEKSYVQIYTGNGKGKTTAAVGLAVRALGSGRSVKFVQFLKGRQTGEMDVLKDMGGAEFFRVSDSKKFFLHTDGAGKTGCNKTDAGFSAEDIRLAWQSRHGRSRRSAGCAQPRHTRRGSDKAYHKREGQHRDSAHRQGRTAVTHQACRPRHGDEANKALLRQRCKCEAGHRILE